jgi:hypothetical protein
VTDIAAFATLQTIEPPTTLLPLLTSLPTLTLTSTLSPTPSVTASISPSETPLPSEKVSPIAPLSDRQVGPRDFISAFIGLMLLAVAGFTAHWATSRSVNAGLRLALGTAVGGLIGYIYYAGKLPGADILRLALPDYGAVLSTVIIGVIGLLIGWLSLRRLNRNLY